MLTARPCPERIRHFVLSGLRPVDRSSPNWYASFTNSLRALVVFLRDLTHDAEPEREPRPAVVADDPGPAAALALQRGAGNAAVARMLTTASARMQVMRITAAEQAWNTAVQDKDWAGAVGILDDLTDEEVKRLVGALADEDQSALGNAVLTLPRKDRERMRSRLEFLLEGAVPDAETTIGLRDFTITDAGAREHQGSPVLARLRCAAAPPLQEAASRRRAGSPSPTRAAR